LRGLGSARLARLQKPCGGQADEARSLDFPFDRLRASAYRGDKKGLLTRGCGGEESRSPSGSRSNAQKIPCPETHIDCSQSCQY